MKKLNLNIRKEQSKSLSNSSCVKLASEIGIAQAILAGDSELVMNVLGEEGLSLACYDNLIIQNSFLGIFLSYVAVTVGENIIKLLIVWLNI